MNSKQSKLYNSKMCFIFVNVSHIISCWQQNLKGVLLDKILHFGLDNRKYKFYILSCTV